MQMEVPQIQRFGDTWTLAWPSYQVALGFEKVSETRDGVVAQVVVISQHPERPQDQLWGPARLNLLSMQSQTQWVNQLSKRLDTAPWADILVTACAIVVKQFTAPSPTINLADVDLEAYRVEHLVSGLLPLGETTFCYGDSESLKSMLGGVIAVCVTQGLALPWGVLPSRTERVLYCDWETNEVVIAERIRRIAAGLGINERVDIHYRGTLQGKNTSPLRTLTDEVPSIREQIQREKIGLVIVDSIGFAVDGKLVDDDVARAAMSSLRQLTPATRLAIAHISKESIEKTGRVDPFGSAFFRAGIRSGFEVRRSTQESLLNDIVDVGIFHWKSNDGSHIPPFGLRFVFEPNRGAIRVRTRDLHEVPDLAMRTSLSSRLRNALKAGAATVADLAEQLEANPDTVKRTLNRMPDVTRLEEGGGRGNVTTWGLKG